jgi:hypothetical protein
LRASDKLLLVGKNYLRHTGNAPAWRQTAAGADEVATGFATTRAYDDRDYLDTKPGSAQNTWLFTVDLGSTHLAEFDHVTILGLDSLTCQIEVEIADDAAMTSNKQTLATAASGTHVDRVVFDELYHTGSTARRYSSVRYLQIKFTGTGIQPEFGELIIGRSRQMKFNPLTPFDRKNLVSNLGVYESYAGTSSTYAFYTNRRKIVATLLTSEDAYSTEIETFFKTDTEGGTLPFLWIDKPGTVPDTVYWMYFQTPALSGANTGWARRDFLFDCLEVGPNFMDD